MTSNNTAGNLLIQHAKKNHLNARPPREEKEKGNIGRYTDKSTIDTNDAIAIYPRASNRRHRHAVSEHLQTAKTRSPWYLSSVGTDRQKHCVKNTAMKVQEAAKEYTCLGWSGKWMGEIPKFECAYADAHGSVVGFAWHWHCTDTAESVQRVNSRTDGRHSGRMSLSDSARKGTELLVSGSRKPDSTRA
jgi:hypothetical protein